MAYFGKVFVLEEQDNYDGFIRSLGLSEDKVQLLLKAHPSQKIVKNGEDDYTLSIITGNYPRDLTFKCGVEFNSKLGEFDSQSTLTVAGDTITHVEKFSDGRTITFKKEFSANKVKETITSNLWDGKACRYYTAT